MSHDASRALDAVVAAWHRSGIRHSVVRSSDDLADRPNPRLRCRVAPDQVAHAERAALSVLTERRWRTALERHLGSHRIIAFLEHEAEAESLVIELHRVEGRGPPTPGQESGRGFLATRIVMAMATAFSPRRSPIIAFVGPDGVGKSSLIRALGDWASGEVTVAQSVQRHWRPGLLPPLRTLVGQSDREDMQIDPPRRDPGRFQGLRLFYYWMDFLLGHWWKDVRGDGIGQPRIIFYDRCALDMVVDPVRYGLSSSWGARLLWGAVPHPDRVFALIDTPARIHARKPELSEDEIAAQTRTWLQLARAGHVDGGVRVDAPPKVLARRLKQPLVTALLDGVSGESATDAERETRFDELLTVLGFRTPEADGKLGQSASQSASRRRVSPGGQMALVPPGRRPRLLVPLHTPRASAAAMKLYHPQRKVAKVGKHLLRLALRVGLAQPFLRSRMILGAPGTTTGGDHGAPDALDVHLARIFDVSGVTLSVSLGTPGPHRKPLIQVATSNGRILGYVKVGWNQETITLVQREESYLLRLRPVAFSKAAVPRVIDSGPWGRCYLLVQSAPDHPWRGAAGRMSATHLTFLKELIDSQEDMRSSSIDPWLHRIEVRLKNLRKRGLYYHAHLIEWALETCWQQARPSEVPLGPCHGDFAPWNTLETSDGIFVLDWEYAQASSPVGWDFFHFVVQSSVLVDHLTGHKVSARLTTGTIREMGEELLGLLAVPSGMYKLLLALYVSDVMSWYLLRDARGGSAKSRALVKVWETILFLFSSDALVAEQGGAE